MKEQISENISTKYMRSMCKKPFQLKEEDEIMPFQQKVYHSTAWYFGTKLKKVVIDIKAIIATS